MTRNANGLRGQEKCSVIMYLNATTQSGVRRGRIAFFGTIMNRSHRKGTLLYTRQGWTIYTRCYPSRRPFTQDVLYQAVQSAIVHSSGGHCRPPSSFVKQSSLSTTMRNLHVSRREIVTCFHHHYPVPGGYSVQRRRCIFLSC